MSNKVVIGSLILTKESDEVVSIVFTDKNGQPNRAIIGMNHALEMSRQLTDWVCQSWLE